MYLHMNINMPPAFKAPLETKLCANLQEGLLIVYSCTDEQTDILPFCLVTISPQHASKQEIGNSEMNDITNDFDGYCA